MTLAWAVGSGGWTGGQYSLLRIAAGVLVALVHPWLLPLAIPFALGWHDRLFAVLLAFGALFLTWGSGGATIEALGLALFLRHHVFLPPAPFGSWAARGRIDPEGGWELTDEVRHRGIVTAGLFLVFATLWQPLFAGSMAGWHAPWRMLDLLAVLLLFHSRTRSFALPLVLLATASECLVFGGTAFGLGRLLLVALAWEPARILPRRLSAEPELVFYDGTCGLCHMGVRTLLAEDQTGAFRIAPLFGSTFEAVIPEPLRLRLPDTMGVVTHEPKLLVRSDATAHLLRGLGGGWRVLGEILHRVPRPLRDLAYDAMARVRHRIFERPANVCPMMPPRLAGRFLP